MARDDPKPKMRGAGGGKGGGSSAAAKEAPNTLQSKTVVQLLELLGEGPIKGFPFDNPKKGIVLSSGSPDSTPIMGPDGGENYSGASVAVRLGDPTQDPIPGYHEQATPAAVGVAVRNEGDPVANSVTRRISGSLAAARVILQLDALLKVDTKTGDQNGHTVEYSIDVKSAADQVGSVFVEKVHDRITGKTISAWQKQYRIALTGNSPWDIRVRRLSPDDEAASTQSGLSWTSYETITEYKLGYPHSAIVALTADTQQFGTSIPTRGFLIEGLIVQVPSNYDAEARTYTAFWNGTFTTAYTNNPAWVLYDILSNNRYGLGDIFTAARLSLGKWDLYQIAKYCDGYNARPGGTTNDYHPVTGKHGVPDGKGGFEPRFTFNASINTKMKAYEALAALMGMMRSAMIWSGGKLRFIQDSPQSAIKVFSAANVVEGLFNYVGTALRARTTAVRVTFLNPDRGYQPDDVLLEDTDAIQRFGYNLKEETAFGCTSYGQAVRHGRNILVTERLETDSVQFKIGAGEIDMLPGQIMKIEDPAMTQAEWGGRVKKQNSASTYELDRVVTLEAERTYTFTVVGKDGVIRDFQIDNAIDCTTNTITLTTAVLEEEQPVLNAMWVISSDVRQSRLFRLVALAEEGEGVYRLAGMEYAPQKYEEIDRNIVIPEQPFSDLPTTGTVEPVPEDSLTLQYYNSVDGSGTRGTLELDWRASPDYYLSGYIVEYQEGENEWVRLPVQRSTNFRLINPRMTVIRFRVFALNMMGDASIARVIDVDMSAGTATDKTPVTNLYVLGTAATVWTGRDLPLQWDASSLYGTGTLGLDGTDPYFKNFRVKLINPDTDAVLKTYTTRSTRFTIPYQDMVSGGLRRSYEVEITVEDINGGFSLPTVSTFTNPAPALVAGTYTSTPYQITFNFPPGEEADFEGTIVWMSTTDGFTPAGTVPGEGNCVWAAAGNPVIPVDDGQTYYFRFAHFDAFGMTELETSTQQSITTPTGAGGDGLNNATVFIYKRSATAPTLPSAATTYTFATKALTGLNNGWTTTIPAGTDPLYVSAATASSTGETDTIPANEWAAVVILARDGEPGEDGSDGLNSATVFLYKRSATLPTVPAGALTYTFATGVLSGTLNGWSQSVPAGTDPVYITTATALSASATDSIASGEWAAPNILAQNGASGAAGMNNARPLIYKRSATAPTLPSAATTYTFATGVLTGLNNGWTQTVPAGTDPLYVSGASANSTSATDTIDAGEWATPVVLAQDGDDGLNTATIFLYKRSATAPTVPSGTLTYTFATSALSGTLEGWTQSVPAGTDPVYITTATALSTGTTDAIGTGEWATPRILAQNGANGAAGSNNATVFLYQRAASTPSAPTGVLTYTFSAKTLTGTPGSGWQTTIPAGTDPLYVIAATASATTDTDNIATNEWSSPVILTLNGVDGDDGVDGVDGLNSATVFLYQRGASATPPALPSTSSTYTFASAALTGHNNGWSQTVPSSGGSYLFVTTATAVGTGATDTIPSSEWAAARVLSQNGVDGSNNVVVYLYQRAASTPSGPSGSLTYTFSTKALTGTPGNGWQTTIPAGNNPLYIVAATASSLTDTDTIANNEWSSPVIFSVDGTNGTNGTNGLNSATVFLYQRAITNSAPALPSASATYTFATGGLTGHNNGWTTTVPSSGGSYLFVTTATAAATTATDTILSSEWAAARLMAQDGLDGVDGSPITLVPVSGSSNLTINGNTLANTGGDGYGRAATSDPLQGPCFIEGDLLPVGMNVWQMLAFDLEATGFDYSQQHLLAQLKRDTGVLYIYSGTSLLAQINTDPSQTGKWRLVYSGDRYYVRIGLKEYGREVSALQGSAPVHYPKFYAYSNLQTYTGFAAGASNHSFIGTTNLVRDASFEGIMPTKVSASDGGGMNLTWPSGTGAHGTRFVRPFMIGAHSWRYPDTEFVAKSSTYTLSCALRDSGVLNSSYWNGGGSSAVPHPVRFGLYDTVTGTFFAGSYDPAFPSINLGAGEVNIPQNAGWARYARTITGLVPGRAYQWCQCQSPYTGDRIVDSDAIQIEQGGVATDFKLNPEDDVSRVLTQASNQIINYDWTGATTAQLPKTLQNVMKKGTVDVTSATTFQYTPAGCTITTSGMSYGQVSLTGVSSANASIVVRATYEGVTRQETILIERRLADPPPPTTPPTPPGSGGAGSSFSANINRTVTDTSYDGTEQVLAQGQMTSSASGQIRFVLNADYTVNPAGSISASATMTTKAQYSTDGSSWTDAGISGTGTAGSSGFTNGEGQWEDGYPGSISVNQLKSGLSNTTDYHIRWVGYFTGGTASSVSAVGSISGAQS